METILNKELIVNKSACRLIGVLGFVALMSLGAFVRIPVPFSPVPITLQTFFVLLSGAFLGAGPGLIAQAGYIFLGISGLSVFTGAGSGLAYLWGPTAGYLWGFILCVFFIGKSIKYAPRNLLSTFAIFCLGDLILLFSGAIWLKLLLGYKFTRILFIGFLPFLPGDLLKALVAASLYLKLRSRLKEVF
ncbi:MAG: biotin transporter BioY [Candidatus Omnitrophota bacterium]|jgi:biotin transport system substrate-specific component